MCFCAAVTASSRSGEGMGTLMTLNTMSLSADAAEVGTTKMVLTSPPFINSKFYRLLGYFINFLPMPRKYLPES